MKMTAEPIVPVLKATSASRDEAALTISIPKTDEIKPIEALIILNELRRKLSKN